MTISTPRMTKKSMTHSSMMVIHPMRLGIPLVWYLDVEIDGKGSGSLTISDQQDGSSPLSRAWGNGATEKAHSELSSKSGEHRITLPQGETSVVHLKVAGALVRSWSL